MAFVNQPVEEPEKSLRDYASPRCEDIKVWDLYASVDECLQAMEAMKHRMEDLEHVVEDNYKFLNRNVHKLFGMVGNMRGKWCNTFLKYH
jgi:hypothetical protein